MKVPLDKLQTMMREMLATSGAEAADVELLATIKLEQDLHQNYFSGLEEVSGPFVGAVETLKKSIGKKETVEVDKPALKLINCHGRATPLVTAKYIPQLCEMAHAQGIAILGLYGGGYQEGLDMFARQIAERDLVGLVSSAGGPQGVVPLGGKRAIMGTNPFAYAIPTNDLPIAFDAATALYPWGSIRKTKKAGAQLPKDAYLDEAGNWTTDPGVAVSIIPFGAHKGYAINVMLEVLCGALVQAKSGLLQKSEEDLGGFLIAIDPAAFGSLEEFKKQTTQLADDIAANEPAEGYDEVRVPGRKGERHKQAAIAANELEVPDALWQEFEAAYHKMVG